MPARPWSWSTTSRPAFARRCRRRCRSWSAMGATHLIKVAVETALGLRPRIEVFGTDYVTPDGTCIRDYIHVTDLVRAHSAALAHLRRDGGSATFNCGYGHGASVLAVIEAGKRVSGCAFAGRLS